MTVPYVTSKSAEITAACRSMLLAFFSHFLPGVITILGCVLPLFLMLADCADVISLQYDVSWISSIYFLGGVLCVNLFSAPARFVTLALCSYFHANGEIVKHCFS